MMNLIWKTIRKITYKIILMVWKIIRKIILMIWKFLVDNYNVFITTLKTDFKAEFKRAKDFFFRKREKYPVFYRDSFFDEIFFFWYKFFVFWDPWIRTKEYKRTFISFQAFCEIKYLFFIEDFFLYLTSFFSIFNIIFGVSSIISPIKSFLNLCYFSAWDVIDIILDRENIVSSCIYLRDLVKNKKLDLKNEDHEIALSIYAWSFFWNQPFWFWALYTFIAWVIFEIKNIGHFWIGLFVHEIFWGIKLFFTSIFSFMIYLYSSLFHSTILGFALSKFLFTFFRLFYSAFYTALFFNVIVIYFRLTWRDDNFWSGCITIMLEFMQVSWIFRLTFPELKKEVNRELEEEYDVQPLWFMPFFFTLCTYCFFRKRPQWPEKDIIILGVQIW